ncbi:MAG: hypothetical protein LBL34_00685 [Clostridiales bacterium]|nr:hypothetical protein [Clostridiales bacterium]
MMKKRVNMLIILTGLLVIVVVAMVLINHKLNSNMAALNLEKEEILSELDAIKQEKAFENWISAGGYYLGTYKDGVWHSYMGNEELNLERTEQTDAWLESLDKNKNNDENYDENQKNSENDVENRKNDMRFFAFDQNHMVAENLTSYFPDSVYGNGYLHLPKFVHGDKLESEDYKKYLFITGDYNPLPKNGAIVKENITNTGEYSKYYDVVKKLLREKGVNGTEVKIDKIISADIDNDGAVEHFIAANASRAYEMFSEETLARKYGGAYSIICMVKDDFKDVKELFTHVIPTGEEESASESYCIYDILGIYDLNNDGICEVIVSGITWDIPEAFAYEYKANEFKPVLYGGYAW